VRIALLGAGAMGTIIGALLTEGGHDIELVDNYREHVDALNSNGAKIIGKIEKTIPVKAIMTEQLSGEYDLVLSITKHSAIEESLNGIKPFTHDDTIILTLQNGMPEEKSRRVFPEKNLMGGGMEFSGTFSGPGIAELTSEQSTLGITFGTYNGAITDKVYEIKKILESVGHIEIVDNLRGLRLTKLTDNSVVSGIQTAFACTVGSVLDDDLAMECIVQTGRECAQIIQALGVTPVEFFGILPTVERLGFETEEEKEKVKAYWATLYTPVRDQVASMLQDVRNGKKTEVENINGEMVRLGKTVGVATPCNEKIAELIKKLQDGDQKLDDAWNNREEFRRL